MTDHLTTLKQFIDHCLLDIQSVVPEHRVTLVLRHPDRPDASAVVGDDMDFEAVADAVLTAKTVLRTPLN